MKAVYIVLIALLVTACSINKEYPEVEPYSIAKSQQEYHIGVGDQLSVTVWRNPDLSVNVPVRPDGKISVPLVGDVLASGETAEKLATKVTEELSNFIRTPQVTVIVAQAGSSEFLHRVRVTGAVNNPISVPYRDGMTVMDLVLSAGGLTPFADPNRTKLYRKSQEGQNTYPVYLEDILKKGDLRSNYLLSPSDTITIPESAF